jgi:hypothetical protein
VSLHPLTLRLRSGAARGGEGTLMVEYQDETLAARIEKAFADVPYPGDDRLVEDPRHIEQTL